MGLTNFYIDSSEPTKWPKEMDNASAALAIALQFRDLDDPKLMVASPKKSPTFSASSFDLMPALIPCCSKRADGWPRAWPRQSKWMAL